MKKLFFLCVCFAICIVSAVAGNDGYSNNSGIYTKSTVNGVECRFYGENAKIAALRLPNAKKHYLLYLNKKEINVYKIKNRCNYIIISANQCLYYNGRRNELDRCSYPLVERIKKKEILPNGNKGGFVFGKDPTGKSVLVIYEM